MLGSFRVDAPAAVLPLLCLFTASAGCTTDSGASAVAEDSTSATSGSNAADEGTTADTSGGTTSDVFEPPGTLAASFPLEVIGICDPAAPSCAEVSVAIELEQRPERAASLHLTVHNLVALDSAELSVNGMPLALGTPVDGLLAPRGGVRVGAVEVPVDSLHRGANFITFRYTRQVDDVSGFRVLAVALEADGERVELSLPWEDPSTWSSDEHDGTILAEGRALFSDVSRDGGPTCGRCHTDSGSDLQYFAFSDHAIIERAKLHAMSQREAERIASYIRSLEFPRAGRIFDPPFQPSADAVGAAGAGFDAVLDDAAFGEQVFGPGGWKALSMPVAWDWPEREGIDPTTMVAPIALPQWFQWMPRHLEDAWFEVELDSSGTTFRDLEKALAVEPTLEHAHAFMGAALGIGSRLLAGDPVLAPYGSDHAQRIDLMRFTAVKLWEWSRRTDAFAPPWRGFEPGAPPYPYEVGFAFFEAAQADAVQGAWEQTMAWWWLQLAVDPGRGASDGRRPLDYADVLIAAEAAGLGPNAIVFLHLYGSWEESRGPAGEVFGTKDGPVRLLDVAMRHVDADGMTILFDRFLRHEAGWIAAGGQVDEGHLDALRSTWNEHCGALRSEQREALRVVADAQVQVALSGCP